MKSIDINADVGEGGGADELLLGLVSSASVACGGHAGDAVSIRRTLVMARERGVACGPHPGFPDREGFGRRHLEMKWLDLRRSLLEQLALFDRAARDLGVDASHVKLHGALYNATLRDVDLARRVAEVLAGWRSGVRVMTMPGGAMAGAAAELGLAVVAEGFVDRRYAADGSLLARSDPRGLVLDPDEAAARGLRMVREGVVETVDGEDLAIEVATLCVHGDGASAVAIATALRQRLIVEGIRVAS